MASNPQPAPNAGHDPLFNLKHAEAEAALGQRPDDATDAYATATAADDAADLDEGPRDSQGQRRGETDPTDEGSHAGKH